MKFSTLVDHYDNRFLYPSSPHYEIDIVNKKYYLVSKFPKYNNLVHRIMLLNIELIKTVIKEKSLKDVLELEFDDNVDYPLLDSLKDEFKEEDLSTYGFFTHMIFDKYEEVKFNDIFEIDNDIDDNFVYKSKDKYFIYFKELDQNGTIKKIDIKYRVKENYKRLENYFMAYVCSDAAEEFCVELINPTIQDEYDLNYYSSCGDHFIATLKRSKNLKSKMTALTEKYFKLH